MSDCQRFEFVIDVRDRIVDPFTQIVVKADSKQEALRLVYEIWGGDPWGIFIRKVRDVPHE